MPKFPYLHGRHPATILKFLNNLVKFFNVTAILIRRTKIWLCSKNSVCLDHRSAHGGAEIARPDNAAPYRKGGHRETCFSVLVDGHYKFMFAVESII